MVTAERLRERLHYEPATGEFRWRDVVGARFAGKVAGRLHKTRGYREINIDGRLYYAHRLAWLYVTGNWPTGLIDHRDHDKGNNRWDNLRDVDFIVNGQNRRGAQSNSTTGILGVSPNGSGFRARIQADGRQVSLGTFQTIEAAAQARQLAVQQHAHH